MPYVPLAYPGAPPGAWELVPQPLQLEATHSPAVFVRGATGTITLTVANPTTGATDGSTTTVTHPLPAGLTSTGASGAGLDVRGHHDGHVHAGRRARARRRVPADHARRPRGRVRRPR